MKFRERKISSASEKEENRIFSPAKSNLDQTGHSREKHTGERRLGKPEVCQHFENTILEYKTIGNILKMLLKYTVVLSFMFLIVTCNEKSITSTDTINYYSISGVVFDVINNDSSPGTKAGVPVYIDNDSTISGSDGTFIFQKISEGNHTIKVNLHNYQPFSKSISVTNNIYISIDLHSSVQEDYFPIDDNYQKRFKYSGSSTTWIYTTRDSGEALWKVSSSKFVDSSYVYNIVETLVHKTSGSTRLDTSITNFELSESSTHLISIKGSVLDGVSFNRYMDPRQEQNGVIVKSYHNPGSINSTINIYLKKNVGLNKIEQSGNLGGWHTTYELIP